MKIKPLRNPGTYVFCVLNDFGHIPLSDVLCTFREPEGTTLILEQSLADKHKLPYEYEAAWISLQIDTDLEMVGLTAEFSNELANEGISCNIIAAYHHDHIFVSIDDANNAMDVLREINI